MEAPRPPVSTSSDDDSPIEFKHRTEEESRFDRSIRLWGAEAQQLLRQAHVLLLGATATGCEVLKNMTLPGCGNFTIVDGQKVTKRDLGSNFFLHQSDLGKPRATAAATVLAELNPLVPGNAVDKNVQEYIHELAQGGAEAIRKYTLILVSNLVLSKDLIELGRAVRGCGVPLVYVSVVGLQGIIRIQSDPRYLIHIVPDPELKVEDLRPFEPFPALKAFIDGLNPDDPNMDDETHSHLPWFVVMHYAVNKWRHRKGHDGDSKKLPQGLEWREVKTIIEGMMRKKPGGANEDNFIETRDMCSARLILQNRGFPELKAILAHDRATQPGPNDNVFWFLVHGLKRFKEANDDLMPLPGSVPDFHTSTQLYREVQAIFKKKGNDDAEEIRKYVIEALEKVGRSADEVTTESVHEFAAHAWELNYLKYPSFHRQLADKIDVSGIRPKSEAFLAWYCAHNAAQLFQDQHGHFPGSGSNDTIAKDLTELIDISKHLIGDQHTKMIDQHLAEMVRAGGGEPVAIASILGAVASQECIKLIQNRRVPICHSLVFDGIVNEFGTIDVLHHHRLPSTFSFE